MKKGEFLNGSGANESYLEIDLFGKEKLGLIGRRR